MNLGFRHDFETLKWMKLLAIGLLAVMSLGLVPHAARAQDMSFDINETESTPKDKGKAKAKAKGKAAKEEEPAPAEAEAGASGEASGGDVMSDISSDKGKKEKETDEGGLPREKEVAEKIYAVQRMYVLRRGRFELAPSMAFTVNDQYVTHNALAVGLNYWVTNVLAVGANFLWYQGIESESALNFAIRRSARLAVPVTQYQLGGNLNFTYVPIYGKFEMFNDSIFQWDAYLVGGVGVLRTRPVAVIDPAIRTYDFDWRVAFNAGVGLRVFLTKWLTVFGELRDYIYMEKLESLQVSLSDRKVPTTWIDANSTLTNNVMMHVGITMFFPFTFEYRYPK